MSCSLTVRTNSMRQHPRTHREHKCISRTKWWKIFFGLWSCPAIFSLRVRSNRMKTPVYLWKTHVDQLKCNSGFINRSLRTDFCMVPLSLPPRTIIWFLYGTTPKCMRFLYLISTFTSSLFNSIKKFSIWITESFPFTSVNKQKHDRTRRLPMSLHWFETRLLYSALMSPEWSNLVKAVSALYTKDYRWMRFAENINSLDKLIRNRKPMDVDLHTVKNVSIESI